MSPEQARGEDVHARSDIFSFGAVLYEMATGGQTFSGNTTAVIFHPLLDPGPMPSAPLTAGLPTQLFPVVCRALEKNPDLRYQTGADLRADLLRLKRDTDSTRPARVAGAPHFGRCARGCGARLCFQACSAPAQDYRFREDHARRRWEGTDGHGRLANLLHGVRQALSGAGGGSDAQPLPTSLENVSIADISPDHAELLTLSCLVFAEDCDVWTVPAMAPPWVVRRDVWVG